MKRIQLLAPMLGLALAASAGCDRRDRTDNQRKGHLTTSAKDETRKTSLDDDINSERARLDDSVTNRNRRINDYTGSDNTAVDRRDRDDDDDDVRKPVAGREDFARDLQDKLGDDWRVEPHNKTWVAVRRNIKPASDDMRKKVNNEVKDLRDDHKDLSMLYSGGSEMILRGTMKDCGETIDAVDKFADIDGINRIVVELACARK